MIRKITSGMLAIVVVLIATGCAGSPEEQYREREQEELNKGIRNDSLFLGLYLRMSREEFREYCFNMNLKGKFKQGGRKNWYWVESKLDHSDYPAAITFYPAFLNDSISEMHAAIYYDNAKFRDGTFESDSLMQDVLNILDRWYGKETFRIKSPLFYKEDVYVKVNGNRRITIYPDASGQMVNLWFVDLTTIKKDNHG
jgi:hypothetical protein